MEWFLYLLLLLIVSAAGFMAYQAWLMDRELSESIVQLDLKHRHSLEQLQQELAKKRLEIDNITEVVDISAYSVERIHQSIAETSFNLVGSVKPVKAPAQAIQKAHDITAKEVYSSIRKVNRLVGDISKTLSGKESSVKSPSSKDMNSVREETSDDRPDHQNPEDT